MSTAPHTPDTYDRLIDDLTYAYDGVFSPETIATVVHEARDLLEPRATITQYLPIFVAKQARERLMTVAQAEGRVAKQVPEILFVCVHNAGRSQMAAGYLQALAGDRVQVLACDVNCRTWSQGSAEPGRGRTRPGLSGDCRSCEQPYARPACAWRHRRPSSSRSSRSWRWCSRAWSAAS